MSIRKITANSAVSAKKGKININDVINDTILEKALPKKEWSDQPNLFRRPLA